MSKYLFGTLIILGGVYFLFENLGYDIGLGDKISNYWPILIIVLGLKVSFEGLAKTYGGMKTKRFIVGHLLFGLFIVGIGVVFLGNNLGWFMLGLRDFWNIVWPVLIIYLGASLLFQSTSKDKKDRRVFIEVGNNKKSVNVNRKKHVIGESIYGLGKPWTLEDIQLWHGVGSTEVDLSTAIIPDKESFVDITGLIGEVKILVPYDLPVKVNVDVRVGEVTVFNHNQSGAGRFISYASENYEQATKKVNIMISLSVGEVTVKQVD